MSPGVTTNGPNATHVLGQPDFTTTDSGETASTLDNPNGIAVDPETNKLYVDDEYNYRVMIYDIESIVDGEDAVMVLGQADFETIDCSCGSNTNQFNMYYATGVAVNPSTHELYLADGYLNDRYLIFDFARLTTSSLTTGTTGSNYSQTLSSTGSQGDVSYAIVSGSLPPGLLLDTSTGAITGTPTQAGDYAFAIQLSDDNGAVGTYTHTKSYVLGITGSSSNSGGSTPTTTTTSTTDTEESTDEPIAQTDTETPEDTTTSTPTPAPKTTQPDSNSLSVVWWGVGGVSLFLILLFIGMWVVKNGTA